MKFEGEFKDGRVEGYGKSVTLLEQFSHHEVNIVSLSSVGHSVRLCLQGYWLSQMELMVSHETRACFKTTSCKRGKSVQEWCSGRRLQPPMLAVWHFDCHNPGGDTARDPAPSRRASGMCTCILPSSSSLCVSLFFLHLSCLAFTVTWNAHAVWPNNGFL